MNLTVGLLLVVSFGSLAVGLVAAGRRWWWLVVLIPHLHRFLVGLPSLLYPPSPEPWVTHLNVSAVFGGSMLNDFLRVGEYATGAAPVEWFVVAAPAVALLGKTDHRRRWFPSATHAAVLAACALMAAMFTMIGGGHTYNPDWYTVIHEDLPRSVMLFTAGAGIGWRRGRWPWLLAGVVAALLMGYGTLGPFALVAAFVVAACWEPLAGRLDRTAETSPLVPLVALNALNVADAALTHWAIRAGMAAEANPVVDVIGLPGKVLLVAVASWLIHRLRPRALWWPTAALAVVFVWHLAGWSVLD